MARGPTSPSRSAAPVAVAASPELRRDASTSLVPLQPGGRRARTPEGATTTTATHEDSGRRAGSVRVVVRCRPMNAAEKARGDAPLFRFFPKDHREMHVVSPAGHGRELVRSFQFDLCASEELTQTHFFRSCGVTTLLDSVAEGYVATVFAYGQTGSGKTYSMSGIEELLAVARKKTLEPATRRPEEMIELSDGIIPRAVKYLFSLFEHAPKDVRFVVRASYCEIYNEHVYDLLNPASGCLHVRWNDRSGFYVQDLLVVQCDSIDDVMAVVHEGHRNRRVGTHEMNKDSSRSHSIMTIHVDRQTTDPNDGHVVTKYGKMSFVDLAGSERLKETKSSNTEETSNINRSLLTLGKVISALASKTSANFIPYRDSKLTKLLMDSLGGSALTLMIACVSPSASSLEDTLSTLNYATRAKNIQNKPTVQVDPMEMALSMLHKENHALRAENEALRLRLRTLAANGRRDDANQALTTSMSRSTLPPLLPESSQLVPSSAASRRDGKTPRSPKMKAPPSVEAYKNQLVALQEENEKLMRHATSAEQRLRQVKAENEALLLRLAEVKQQPHSPTKTSSPTKSSARRASGDEVQQLRQQVQQLLHREQELMQALIDRKLLPSLLRFRDAMENDDDDDDSDEEEPATDATKTEREVAAPTTNLLDSNETNTRKLKQQGADPERDETTTLTPTTKRATRVMAQDDDVREIASGTLAAEAPVRVRVKSERLQVKAAMQASRELEDSGESKEKTKTKKTTTKKERRSSDSDKNKGAKAARQEREEERRGDSAMDKPDAAPRRR
ncbi:hypothetical protein ATCC90586_006789 [Pythium insidiosum]|nr:hypothetical protein ATCC90586_006789 [Pythium insidiosum]